MPFDEEDDDSLQQVKKNVGLKNVSTQKSIFDNVPKKPSAEEFSKKVDKIQDASNSYKIRGMELSSEFLRVLNDKTLKQNKSIFAKDLEKEVINKLLQLSIEINNDASEQEGMGSLAVITLLLKVVLLQRDKINELDYTVSDLNKKIDAIIDTLKKNE